MDNVIQDKKKKSKGKGSVKVSQPISGQGQQQMQQQPSPDQSAQMQSLYGGSTPINQLPSSSTSTQQLPDYNAMYNQADQNPLVGAATPGFGEVLASNEFLGGN